MIKLFDIENGVVKPTVHCYQISWLKAILDKYKKDSTKILGYLYYTTCPSDDNPYVNLPEDTKEDAVINALQITTSLEAKEIVTAKNELAKLFETPSMRAYHAVKVMLDRISTYLETTSISDGKEGNAADIARWMDKIDSYRQTYKNAYRDMQDELTEKKTRGNQKRSYDDEENSM